MTRMTLSAKLGVCCTRKRKRFSSISATLPWGDGRDRGASRSVVDERHLTDDSAGGDLLVNDVAVADLKLAGAHDIDALRGIAFPEQRLAGSKRQHGCARG